VLFLAISLLSLTPRLAHAGQQTVSASSPITLNATGQATAIGNGTSGPTKLNLTGASYENANQWLIIQNVTGSLHIGATAFTITGGQGSISKFGDMAIFGDTTTEKNQLTLHGTRNGSNISFYSPQSQLDSIAYLSLTGSINQTAQPPDQSTNATTSPNAPINSTTNSRSEQRNATVALATSTSLINATFAYSKINTTLTANTTLLNANLSADKQSTTDNATNSTSTNGNTQASLPSSSVTVTVTQYVNQITSTTRTVANMTIYYTVTTTVENTTLTKGNVTMTQGNSTISTTETTGT
jgi:hypothetical protein